MKSDIIRRYRRKLRRVQLNFRRMNFTLIGDEGKPWRRAIAIAAGVLLLLVALIFGRAETQLMSSAEVKTVQERGVLRIGVIPDMPGAELESELHRLHPRQPVQHTRLLITYHQNLFILLIQILLYMLILLNLLLKTLDYSCCIHLHLALLLFHHNGQSIMQSY